MVARNVQRFFKRHGPTVVLVLALIFGAISVWQVWDIATHLQREARETSRIYGQIVAALNDPGAEAATLFELSKEITNTGIPLVLTNSTGRPTAAINLPFDSAAQFDLESDPRIREFIAELDRRNPPVEMHGYQVHYGWVPVARRLTVFGVLQVAVLLLAIVIGFWAYRTAMDRSRNRLWVAMARESAHQLGTPLMNASAWVERLADHEDAGAREIAKNLAADLERLERVAKRFERIGRPARRAEVGLGTVAERVATYFQPRLPRHANPVSITVKAPDAGPLISADPVLIEWAIEALVRNSIDALSGRGGSITVSVDRKGDTASVTVRDDGPGVPIELRSQLFEPGFTTKQGGWGIGLALARRIIEEVHGGRIELAHADDGAVFVADLPVTTSDTPSD